MNVSLGIYTYIYDYIHIMFVYIIINVTFITPNYFITLNYPQQNHSIYNMKSSCELLITKFGFYCSILTVYALAVFLLKWTVKLFREIITFLANNWILKTFLKVSRPSTFSSLEISREYLIFFKFRFSFAYWDTRKRYYHIHSQLYPKYTV